jgi:2-oxoglutarate dehydrogenase E1 component
MGGIMKIKKHWKLRELIDSLNKIYSSKVGFEYMHINDTKQLSWLRDRIEAMPFQELSKDEKILHYERLKRVSMFDTYCSAKFKTSKRFGAEGCEGFMPGLRTILDTLVDLGSEKVIIGMPHRGRLNVLSDIVQRPKAEIFAEFKGARPQRIEGAWGQLGDVKYHWGTQKTTEYPNGKALTVMLLPNPSHLEYVNPVVLGRVRAE